MSYSPPNTPLEIIFEDNHLIVVDKPSGLLSVPGRGPDLVDCLLTRVQYAFPTALLVHRLDRDTSGVMVFAANPAAQRHLSAQFENRKTKKTYVARIWGKLAQGAGEVDLPMIVDWPNRPKQKICHEIGKPALTKWKVLRQSDEESRVRLWPRTGRSHQLRVHMQALGHPILGDPFYAHEAAREGVDRLMLHSQELRICHPGTSRGMTFRAKEPF